MCYFYINVCKFATESLIYGLLMVISDMTLDYEKTFIVY